MRTSFRGSVRARGLALGGLALAAVGCGPSQEAGFDQSVDREAVDGAGDEEAEDGAGDEADDSNEELPGTLVACEGLLEGLEGIEGGRDALAGMELIPALSSIPELSRVASAFETPSFMEQLERYGEVTVFAPLDEGMQYEQQEGGDTGAESDEARSPAGAPGTSPPPESYVSPDGVLLLSDLLETGQVEVADGASVSVERDGDSAIVRRGETSVEVVCADIEVDDAVVHVLEGEPYDRDDDELTPGAEQSQAPVGPGVQDELDELDEPGEGDS